MNKNSIDISLHSIDHKKFDHDFLWALLESLQEGVFAVEDEKFILTNSAVCELLGYTSEELIGRPLVDVVEQSHKSMVLQRSRERLLGNEVPELYEIGLLRSDDTVIHVQIKVSAFQVNSGTPVIVGSVRDISSEKRILAQLQKSEQEFRRIVENLPDIFYRTDANGRIILASPYAAYVMGYELSEIIGQPLADFYANPEEREPTLLKILEGKGEMVPVESCLLHRDGSTIWVSTHAFARYDENKKLIGVEGVARNITERKIMEERLRYMAIRDPLTQVANRFGFDECLTSAITRARRQKSKIALLFFDLDKFKLINDNYGHDVGDRYLAAFARRLEIGFRETDSVARLGGDEFVVLLENVEDDEMIYSLLERCITALSDPFVDEEYRLPFQYSYGISQYPVHGVDAESLLKSADAAMYDDKNRKKPSCE